MLKRKHLLGEQLTEEKDHSLEGSVLVARVINALENGAVVFEYEKQDGTIKVALGTRAEPLIPSKKQLKSEELYNACVNLLKVCDDTNIDSIRRLVAQIQSTTSYKQSDEWINYWDFSANGWRKFHVDNLRAIYEV